MSVPIELPPVSQGGFYRNDQVPDYGTEAFERFRVRCYDESFESSPAVCQFIESPQGIIPRYHHDDAHGELIDLARYLAHLIKEVTTKPTKRRKLSAGEAPSRMMPARGATSKKDDFASEPITSEFVLDSDKAAKLGLDRNDISSIREILGREWPKYAEEYATFSGYTRWETLAKTCVMDQKNELPKFMDWARGWSVKLERMFYAATRMTYEQYFRLSQCV